MTKETRIEHDLLGSLEIPADAYWGIHSKRAMENFQISGYAVSPALVHAIAVVKKACCLMNGELGYLSANIVDAILTACEEIGEGKFDSQFPLDALQGGAGTSTNMNVNEVIANRALEIMGYGKGEYEHCHPIEHVNLHQSTNDVYPTALKIAAIRKLRELSAHVAHLQAAFQQKEKEFPSIVIIGRTELQDAVPITLGAQFSSFADAIARDRWRTFKCEERLRVVNIGGTAVGTGLTAPRSYIFGVIEKLRECTGLGLTRGENLPDATANADPFVEVSGTLDSFGANLIKVASDLRLLHMEGEIKLPPVQAGSSIMPGKVNPVIIEAVIQTGMKVAANHSIIRECVSRGSLQINEFLPLLGFALLESLDILSHSSQMFAIHVNQIKADESVCSEHLSRSTTIITAFVPHIGYERAQELIHEFACDNTKDFKKFLCRKLGEDMVADVLSPSKIMALGYK